MEQSLLSFATTSKLTTLPAICKEIKDGIDCSNLLLEVEKTKQLNCVEDKKASYYPRKWVKIVDFDGGFYFLFYTQTFETL